MLGWVAKDYAGGLVLMLMHVGDEKIWPPIPVSLPDETHAAGAG